MRRSRIGQVAPIAALAVLVFVASSAVSDLVRGPRETNWVLVGGTSAVPTLTATTLDAAVVGIVAAVGSVLVAWATPRIARRWFDTLAVAVGASALVWAMPGVASPSSGSAPDLLTGVGAALVIGVASAQLSGPTTPIAVIAAASGALLPLLVRHDDDVPFRYRHLVHGASESLSVAAVTTMVTLASAVAVVAVFRAPRPSTPAHRAGLLASIVPMSGVIVTLVAAAAASSDVLGVQQVWIAASGVAAAVIIASARRLSGGDVLLPMATVTVVCGAAAAGAGGAAAGVVIVAAVLGIASTAIVRRSRQDPRIPDGSMVAAASTLPLSLSVFGTTPPMTADFGWTAYTPLTDAISVSPTYPVATVAVAVALIAAFTVAAVLPRRRSS